MNDEILVSSRVIKSFPSISQGKMDWKKEIVRNTLPQCDTHQDVLLLAKTNEVHYTLSRHTIKKLFEQAYRILNDQTKKDH